MSPAQLDSDPAGNASDSVGACENAAPPKRRDGSSAGSATLASRRILGLRVDATSYAETCAAALELAAAGAGGAICCATTHMVMEGRDDRSFRRLVNASERVTPDGMPLVWALRALGVRRVARVYGPDLTLALCARAEAAGVAVGFYGGHPEVVEALRARLLERHPRLSIPFVWSPPFRPLDAAEDERICEAIEAAGVGILFVGLGCPRQERWVAAHRERLACVLVAVGAAFDFIAGSKAQAPRWMMGAGLEWLFRLGCEPRRLWRRYLVDGSRFLFLFLLRRNPS